MRKIGKYQITGELGRGGMGRVLKVRHPEIFRILAAKVFAPHPFLISSVGEKRLHSMFIEEARKMATLSHPNIAGVEDLHCGETTFYTMPCYSRSLGMVMGENAEMEAPCRSLDPGSALHFLHQLLTGLHCLHFHRIIHRDIKPWNLLLDDEDRLILGDFGLSRLRGETTGTPENIKVGSPWYAPPEQEENADSADERSDIYAASMVFYRMLTGVFPLEKSSSDLLPAPTELWQAFLEKGLACDPSLRFPNVEKMLEALDVLGLSWRRFREKECSIYFHSEETTRQLSAELRQKPLRTGVRGPLHHMLGADALYRPVRMTHNQFRSEPDTGLIYDAATGLLWEKSGSPFPLNRRDADQWIEMLNKKSDKHGGCWRLPTVPELFSITRRTMTPSEYCMEYPFNPRQAWVWTADDRSYVSSWFVDILRGFTAPMDRDGHCYVKGVCGPFSEPAKPF
ncbi:protein kinase [Desulfobotulus sp. H1]|uniref:Protein kinase n=1 Tax=Desulfobotulus pelophilus TaxID=2823377 RepID=A0ABT3N8E5_9BACT|nr:protein kinase [Desulfobotulus pelophilus]